jgi:hypothetical protein
MWGGNVAKFNIILYIYVEKTSYLPTIHRSYMPLQIYLDVANLFLPWNA